MTKGVKQIKPVKPIWTGDAVGLMHVYGIKREQIATRAGLSLSYVESILAGRRTAPDAREKVLNALKEMILTNDGETVERDIPSN